MNINIRTGTLSEVLAIDTNIPEFAGHTTEQTLNDRLTNKASLILIATHDDKPIAYKLGYRLSATEFYSWLGGVIPKYRKQGIATKLRLVQEQWATKNNYQLIRVKSMNKFPNMLQLLISCGYQICGYEDNGSDKNSKIKFVKYL